MMRRWARTCGVFAVAASCALGCSKSTPSPDTGLMIIVSTNMSASEYDSIRVEVSQELGAGSGNWDKLEDENKPVPAEVVLPATVFVRSGHASDQDALIQVTAYLMGQPVVLREAQLQIPTDRVAELRLVLAESCKGQVRVVADGGGPVSTCPMGQSCQPETGSCGDQVIPPDTVLSTYMPGDEKIDAGLAVTGAGGSGSGGGNADGGSADGGSSDASGSASSSSGGGGSSTAGEPPAESEDGDATATEATVDATVAATGSTDSGAPERAATCTDACTAGLTQCASRSVQACQVQGDGCTQWVTTAMCGINQTCMGAGTDAGAASCTCTASACMQTGRLCQDAQTLATCAKDSDGCFYAASTSPCTTPMSCSGMAPSAACSLSCTSSCTSGQTSCVSGGLATCALGTNGCYSYGTPAACGAHQSCTGSAGAAACTCNTDAVCSAVESVCASTSRLVSCDQDPQGCFYEASSVTCTNGACSGSAGAASCCTNACTNGSTQCSGNGVETCSVKANACTVWGVATACPGSAPVCNASSGCGVCQDGSTQCSQNGVQTCANGAWGSVVDCPATTPNCSAGVCVADVADSGGNDDGSVCTFCETTPCCPPNRCCGPVGTPGASTCAVPGQFCPL